MTVGLACKTKAKATTGEKIHAHTITVFFLQCKEKTLGLKKGSSRRNLQISWINAFRTSHRIRIKNFQHSNQLKSILALNKGIVGFEKVPLKFSIPQPSC